MDDATTDSQALPSRLIIASRESRLALWQAEHVRELLTLHYPQCAIEILGMSTRGDRISDRPLTQIGGKGLFIKELEVALQEGRADLAVHSLKDVPMAMPEGFVVAAIPPREDARDAFVSNRYAELAALPAGAVVGTSSLRREALLRERYPHLVVMPLRGNLDTRLRQLDDGKCDAIVLAAAGLIRLGLAERIREYLAPDDYLPAPGQGALGIEIVAERSDLAQWLMPLDDRTTRCCVVAERAFSRALGGSCQVPLGAHASIEDSVSGQLLRLRGFVASPEGQQRWRGERCGAVDVPEALGEELAADLLGQGASELATVSGICR